MRCTCLMTKENMHLHQACTNFSIQGLSDMFMSLESEATVVWSLVEEYALLLEVTMAD